jgi:hypothetical protein
LHDIMDRKQIPIMEDNSLLLIKFKILIGLKNW